MNENYREGSLFIDKLSSRLNIPVIFSAELVPARQDWEQAHFQTLWLSVIGEKCTELHLMDDWEYSNGAAEEFTHVMQLRLGLPKSSNLIFFNTKGRESDERQRMKNIKVYDESGRELTIDDGIEHIARSREWLNSVKLNSAKLDNCYNLLNWTKDKIKEGFYQ